MEKHKPSKADMLVLFTTVVLILIMVIGFTHAATAQEASAPVANGILDKILAAIAGFASSMIQKYPVASSIFLWIGVLRTGFKPLMSALNTFVLATPSTKDDAFIEKWQKSKAYAVFVYVLDWLASVKLK